MSMPMLPQQLNKTLPNKETAIVFVHTKSCRDCSFYHQAFIDLKDSLEEDLIKDLHFYTCDITNSPETGRKFECLTVPFLLFFKTGEFTSRKFLPIATPGNSPVQVMKAFIYSVLGEKLNDLSLPPSPISESSELPFNIGDHITFVKDLGNLIPKDSNEEIEDYRKRGLLIEYKLKGRNFGIPLQALLDCCVKNNF